MEVRPVTLQGHHVILQPLAQAHAESLYAVGTYEPDWAYLPRPCFASLEDTQAWIDETLTAAQNGSQLPFVHTDPTTGAAMGSTRYMNIRARDRVLEIGWTWIGRDYQRTPVNTETKYLLLSHAFESLGAFRVELKTDARNTRSQNAIARIGGVREGLFRKHMKVRDDYQRDTVWFSILAEEWPAVKATLDEKLAR